MKQPESAFTNNPIDIAYLKGRLDFEEVLEALGIVVSHWNGDWLMCHCPDPVMHKNGDTNPSFGFNVDEMYANCFVCGSKTLLQLVQEQLDCSEADAVAWLREQSTFEPAKEDDLLEKIQKILHPVEKVEVMPEFPDSAIFKYRFIHPYLLNRGISKEVIQDFNVGFDEEHLGIVIPHWWHGKLRGWQVRHLLEKDGKYYCPTCGQDNSPTVAKVPKDVAKYNNTVGFPKKYTLYNYDNQLGATVVVVESPMSVLKLATLGIPSVATFGSFSKEQAQALAKFAFVAYWPDNDEAGRKNTEHVLKYLAPLTKVGIVPPVEGEKGDPGDLTSKEEVEEYLDRLMTPATYKLNTTTNR